MSHLGAVPQLEDVMCTYDSAGRADSEGLDRLDALVWALTDLMLTGEAGEPRVRAV